MSVEWRLVTTLALALMVTKLANGYSKNCDEIPRKEAIQGHFPWVTSTVWVGGKKDTVVENGKLDHGGIKMGVRNGCDDGKTHLVLDMVGRLPYTCQHEKGEREPGNEWSDVAYPPRVIKHTLYQPFHQCMKAQIIYLEPFPTSGSHRPVWLKYGEYKFAPPQRWIHNLEHGAIVFLYHPCADEEQVKMFKDLMRRECTCKYITTPYRQPCPRPGEKPRHPEIDKPFALLYWGRSIHMQRFDPRIVTDFIRQHQRVPRPSAPEFNNYREGDYTLFHQQGGCDKSSS